MKLAAASTAEPQLAGAALAVLVIDDQVAVREGLARLLRCAPLPLRAIFLAATPAEALRLAADVRPELVLLDVDLAGEDGLVLIPQLVASARVLVLSCHGDAATRARALRLGAVAFVEKHQPASELLATLTAVAALQTGGEKTPWPHGESTLPRPVASSDAEPASHP